MPRVKRGFKARQRRNKVLKLAKGYRGARSKLFRSATEAVDRALNYAFRDRRVKKRDFRALWITRINAAARINGLSYSKLIHGLKTAKCRNRPKGAGRPGRFRSGRVSPRFAALAKANI